MLPSSVLCVDGGHTPQFVGHVDVFRVKYVYSKTEANAMSHVTLGWMGSGSDACAVRRRSVLWLRIM